MSAAREDWCKIVDTVAGMSSTEPVPSQYVATDYLPNKTTLPPQLVRMLREEDGDYERQAAESYQQQVNSTEGFRARPSAPTFATLPCDDVLLAAHTDGPDFFSNYKKVAGSGNRPSQAAGTTSSLTSGFLDAQAYALTHRQPDFMPIIFVPSSVTSPLQLINIRSFLEEGIYVDPPSLYVDEETGTANVQDTKPSSVIVSAAGFVDNDRYGVAFRQFRVVDNPTHIKDWSHVCACIVEGKLWQLEGLFPEDGPTGRLPSHLFSRVRGFVPYFEEDKVPKAVQEWRVQPLVLTRRLLKTQQHIKQAFVFWEQLYTYLSEHPFFKLYKMGLDD